MKRSQRILINVVSNMAMQGIHFGVSFVMVPLLLRYFGKPVYGIHAYISGIVVLFTFMSSAISMALIKFIPESLALQDYELFNRYWSATALLSALVNIPAGILIAAFPYYGAQLLDVAAPLVPITRQVFLIVGLSTALQFMMPVINGVYYGTEKFLLLNCIRLVAVLASILAYIIVASQGGSLFHYVLILHGGLVLTMVVAGAVLVRKLPCFPKWILPGRRFFRKTLSMNVFLVCNQAAHNFLYSVDKVILQKMFGIASVAEYHVARQADIMMQGIISLPLSAIMPSISSAYTSGDAAYIRKINQAGAFLYCAVMVPPLVVLFCLFDSFIALWVGPGFEDAVLAGRLFAVAIVAVLPLKVFSHSLVASGNVKALGIAKVTYAVLNVPLSIICAIHFGFIGVVIPTAAYWVCVHPVLILVLAAQQALAHGILVNSLLVTAMLPLGWWVARNMAVNPAFSWFSFLMAGGFLYILILLAYVFLVSTFTTGMRDVASILNRLRGVS